MRTRSVLGSVLLHGSLVGGVAALLGTGPVLAERRVAEIRIAPSQPSLPTRPAPDQPAEPVVPERPLPFEQELIEPEMEVPEPDFAPAELACVLRPVCEVQLPPDPEAAVVLPEPTPAEPVQPAPWVEARPCDDLNHAPDYPIEAIRRGESGEVWLRVWVAADGRVSAVEIERASRCRLLDRAALRAVREWQFEPARRHGVPLASHTLVPVEFRLR